MKTQHRRWVMSALAAFLICLSMLSATADFPHAGQMPAASAQAKSAAGRGVSPLVFELNRGQAGSQVDFLARGRGYSLFLTPGAAVFALQEWDPTVAKLGASSSPAEAVHRSAVLRMAVVGADRKVRASGEALAPGRVNYLIGRDPSRWHVHIPLYTGVRYRRVYPGIDLRYHGSQRQLEYDFVVAPHARPQTIRLRFEGASAIAVAPDGGLGLHVGSQHLQWHRPVCYQTVRGRQKAVAGDYTLGKDGLVRFRVGAYDPAKTLVIDPVLVYATYLGGTTIDDASAVAVGRDGSAYIAGYTGYSQFPQTLGLFNQQVAGAFVTKLDPTGSQVIYSTYLGTAGCSGIAVDAEGDAYVVGTTLTPPRPDGGYAGDFPVTPGAFQGRLPPTYDAEHTGFVAELSPDGARLLYGTLFGGSKETSCEAVGLDARKNVYVTGSTAAPDFPVTSGAFLTQWAADGPANGFPPAQAFLAKFDPALSGRESLVYSTFLGSGGRSDSKGLAVDGSGKAVVVLTTTSSELATTPGAFQPAVIQQTTGFVPPIQTAAYVAEMDITGGRLEYATFLGENDAVSPSGVGLDADGHIYVTGNAKPGLPTTPGAFQPRTKIGNPFVIKLDPSDSGAASLLYSTYLGGPRVSQACAIAVDTAGDAYVAGNTDDPAFPTTPDAIDAQYNPLARGVYEAPPEVLDTHEAYLSILDPTGSRLLWSTFLGEMGNTDARSLALDSSGSVYLAGMTTSGLLPTTPGANLLFAPGGIQDGFILKISGETPPGPYIANLRPYPAFIGAEDQMLTINGTGFTAETMVSFNGGPPLPADVVSPKRLTVRLPREWTALPQPVLITIANPSGGWSSAILPVIDPTPKILLLDPSIFPVTVNEVSGVMIFGSGMFPGTTVSFNGGTPSAILYDMPGKSFVYIPEGVLSHPGTVGVVVTNPPPYRGTAHATITVTDHLARPVLIGLRPDHIRAGSRAFDLILYGHHLDYNARVTANGQPVPFAMNSPGVDYETLSVTLPASLLAAPGPVSLVVDNSARGGGPSNTVTLIVDPAP